MPPGLSAAPSDSTVGRRDGGEPGSGCQQRPLSALAISPTRSYRRRYCFPKEGGVLSVSSAEPPGFGTTGQNRTAVSDVLGFLRCGRQRNFYVPAPVTELLLTASSFQDSVAGFHHNLHIRAGETWAYTRRKMEKNKEKSFQSHAGNIKTAKNLT